MKTTDRIESENETWGFYGTLTRNCGLTEPGAATVFDAAGKILVKLTGKPAEDARAYLDGMWGRHLANNFSDPAQLDRLEEVIRGQLENFYMDLGVRGRITAGELHAGRKRCQEMRRDRALETIAREQMGIDLDGDNQPLRRALEAAFKAGACLRPRHS